MPDNLLPLEFFQVVTRLCDAEQVVCRPLVDGQMPNELDVIYQLFPPSGVNRWDIPITCTFSVDDESDVQESIQLMVHLVHTDGDDMVIAGTLYYKQAGKMQRSTGMRFSRGDPVVAVKYDSATGAAYVYLLKDDFKIIQAYAKSEC